MLLSGIHHKHPLGSDENNHLLKDTITPTSKKKLSFCTTCKGRLWQLSQTLPENVKYLNENVELIILDYQSPDGLREHLEENYKEYLDDGRIRYFKLLNNYNFHCAYAKNVVHLLSSGDTLFNLDGDGFIQSEIIEQLNELKDMEILVPRHSPFNEGTHGRLGYTRNTFVYLNGYNEKIVKMQNDDGDLCRRALYSKVKLVHANATHLAIQNTLEQKLLYTEVPELINPGILWPDQWGIADIEDRNGNIFKIDQSLAPKGFK